MGLAYVDKLAKVNNGVKYILVRQDLCDGTVYGRRLEIKDSNETARPFLTTVTEKK